MSIKDGEGTPEAIAYKLFQHIAGCEKRALNGETMTGHQVADRQYILTTYANALLAVTKPDRYDEE